MIHKSVVPLVLKASEMAGTAKLKTVLSTATSRTGSIKTARAVHSLRPARWVTVSMMHLSGDGGLGDRSTIPAGRYSSKAAVDAQPAEELRPRMGGWPVLKTGSSTTSR